jgi:hypothetical protein
MIREIKVFELTCSGCRTVATEFARSEGDAVAKLGWAYREVNNCGMTNYSRDDHMCPKCKLPSDRS